MTSNLWDSAATFERGVTEKVSFVLLNYVDLLLTALAVSLGLTELNPLMRSLLAAPPMLVLFKIVVPVLIAWLTPGRLLVPALLLLSLVVAWNIKELFILLS